MKRSEAQARKTREAKRRNLAEDKAKRHPLPPVTPEGFAQIAERSCRSTRSAKSKLRELKLLWRNAKEMGLLTDDLRNVLTNLANVVKDKAAQDV